MPTNFPASLDDFSAQPPRLVVDLEDALEAVEAKLGTNGSAVSSSIDYKVSSPGLQATLGNTYARVNEGPLSLFDRRVTVDPGAVTDWGAVMNAAKALLPASGPGFDPRGGGEMFAPPGLYPMTTPFDFDSNIVIGGAGNGTLFLCNANIEMFRATAPNSFGMQGLGLKNLKMMVNSGLTATAFATHAWGEASGGFTDCHLTNLKIASTAGGVPVYGAWAVGFDLDFFIENDMSGIMVVNNGTGIGVRYKNASNANHFQGHIRVCDEGVRVEGNSLTFMTDTTIEGCTAYGMNVLSGALRMKGMHLENSPGSVDLRVVNGQSGSMSGSEVVTIDLGIGGAANQVNDWTFMGNAVRGVVRVGTGCLNTVFVGSGGPTPADDLGVDTIVIGSRSTAEPDAGTRGFSDIKSKFRARVFAVTRTANYVLAMSDAGTVVDMNVATANTLTVPPNSSVPFPIGTVIEVCQVGTGQTTIVPGSGVVIAPATKLKIGEQHGSASLRKRDTNEWIAGGNLVA